MLRLTPASKLMTNCILMGKFTLFSVQDFSSKKVKGIAEALAAEQKYRRGKVSGELVETVLNIQGKWEVARPLC